MFQYKGILEIILAKYSQVQTSSKRAQNLLKKDNNNAEKNEQCSNTKAFL